MESGYNEPYGAVVISLASYKTKHALQFVLALACRLLYQLHYNKAPIM